ncbi:hypothetical protein [Phytohabitans suffuscus]|uniref:hypothetical protein n=1 Tax=Phytohabitans suffuscus TaxID=624315 RepID=UPI001E61C483|nr:hypothetical protein [Phytohabitans suffuscus]
MLDGELIVWEADRGVDPVRLLQRLTNVATPAGRTPNQLYAEPGKPLPLTVLPPPSA